jgi:hypothetical protein
MNMSNNSQMKQSKKLPTAPSQDKNFFKTQSNPSEFDIGTYFQEQDRLNPKKARQQQIAYYILLTVIVGTMCVGLMCAIYIWTNNVE